MRAGRSGRRRPDARGGRIGGAAATALVCAQGVLALSTGYLLVLLAAAASARRRGGEAGTGSADLLVLVPAHDEEPSIGETVRSLSALEYPSGRFEVVVIADNCTDRTAAVAAEAGAEVLERADPANPGKGQALAWALGQALPGRPAVSAVVVLDADCRASANLLSAIATRTERGAAAVQVAYEVANPDESWSSALRYAGFALMNVVRPLGRARLGISAGLLGTGMAFSRALLEDLPWDASSIVEDAEYHLRLVAAGRRVEFAPEARVTSPMPTSLGAAQSQQLRWEGGRWQLVRRWAAALAREGVANRDAGRLAAAADLVVPPQSLLGAGSLLLGALATVVRARTAARLAAVTLAGQAAYVIGGLAVVRAPMSAYRALVMAPVLIASKLAIHARLLAGRGPTTWVRTERAPGRPPSPAETAAGRPPA